MIYFLGVVLAIVYASYGRSKNVPLSFMILSMVVFEIWGAIVIISALRK